MNYSYNIKNKDRFNKYIEKYEICKLDKNNSHLLEDFEENISLSQYKTRLGYLICYYLYLKKGIDIFLKHLCIYIKISILK